jgi:hypothetical protein
LGNQKIQPKHGGYRKAWISLSIDGLPYFDEAFVEMSHTLAENLKKSLMNRPEVKLTLEQGGQHQSKYWSECFGPAVSFLFPSETEIQK